MNYSARAKPGEGSLLRSRISALVENAPQMDEAAFAEAALPLLMEADNALDELLEAFGWVRVLAEDERLHEEVGEERFGVEGCEACDVIAAIDGALTKAGLR